MDSLELLTAVRAGYFANIKPMITDQGAFEAARMTMVTPLMAMGERRQDVLAEVDKGIVFVSAYNDLYNALEDATTAPMVVMGRLEACTFGKREI